MAVMPPQGVRVTVAESPRRDLIKVSEWCDFCGMKLNASKTTTMLVSPSLSMHVTMHPQSPSLTSGRTVPKESDGLDILYVTFVSQITFVNHHRSVTRCRIIEMSHDSAPRLVISPRQVRWEKNSFILLYLVKKSEN